MRVHVEAIRRTQEHRSSESCSLVCTCEEQVCCVLEMHGHSGDPLEPGKDVENITHSKLESPRSWTKQAMFQNRECVLAIARARIRWSGVSRQHFRPSLSDGADQVPKTESGERPCIYAAVIMTACICYSYLVWPSVRTLYTYSAYWTWA